QGSLGIHTGIGRQSTDEAQTQSPRIWIALVDQQLFASRTLYHVNDLTRGNRASQHELERCLAVKKADSVGLLPFGQAVKRGQDAHEFLNGRGSYHDANALIAGKELRLARLCFARLAQLAVGVAV